MLCVFAILLCVTTLKTLDNGYKVRATKEHGGKWVFKAIVRQGYTNKPYQTLQESIEAGEKEKEKWLEEMRQEDEEFERKKSLRS